MNGDTSVGIDVDERPRIMVTLPGVMAAIRACKQACHAGAVPHRRVRLNRGQSRHVDRHCSAVALSTRHRTTQEAASSNS